MSTPRESDGLTLSAGSRVQVGLLITLLALAVPLFAAYFQMRTDLAAIRSDLRTIRNNMSDRWSASMMVLYSERMGNLNPTIKMPDPAEVKKDMPLPNDLP